MSLTSFKSPLIEEEKVIQPFTGGSLDESDSSDIPILNFKGLDESLGDP